MLVRILFALVAGGCLAAVFKLGRWYERDGVQAASALTVGMRSLCYIERDPFAFDSLEAVHVYADTSRPSSPHYFFDSGKRFEVWTDKRLTAPGGFS
jgi:hypothetical protein